MARVAVIVMPKEEVLDPQGRAVLGALRALGFAGLVDCRVGKVIRLTFEGEGEADGLRSTAAEMAKALLANPVTEDFRVVVEEGEW